MGNRIGRNRGAGVIQNALNALVDAVVTEVRTKSIRPPAAGRDASVSDGGDFGGGGIGAIRIGLRQQGTPFEDFSHDLFNRGGTLTNDEASTDIDELIARRMRAAGLEPVETEQHVDIASESSSFASRLAWELQIPGQHGNGVSNQDILGFRQEEGRDFAADTSELRDQVKTAVAEQMGHEWDDDRAAEIAQTTILAWIVRRIEEQGVDVDLAPLSSAYKAFKAKHGLDERIGIATGKWLAAVRRANIQVTA